MERKSVLNTIYAAAIALAVFIVFIAAVPSGSHSAYAEEVDTDAVSVLESVSKYASSRGFTSTMYGEVTARVFGIKYVQRVRGERKIKGGDYFERAESVSSFVKAAIEKSRSRGRYYVSHGKFDGNRAEYPDAVELSEADYVASYGYPPLGLIKYDWKGNILSARKTGEGEYTYTLDPHKSTVNSAVEVRTALGCKALPEYRSVEVVLYTDGVKPIKTVCREVLVVDKFGGVECSAVYEESIR